MANESSNPMDFFLQQQAQFWADLQEMKARQDKTSRQLDKNTEQIAKNSEQIASVANLISRLAQVAISIGERMDQLAQAQADAERRWAEGQAHTDRRLDALVDIVDKLIRRNGGAS